MSWDVLRDWFLGLGDKYGVNPIVFGTIYVGAIPFFSLSLAWLIRRLRRRESIVLPALSAAFFFVSAYLYLVVVGRNVPAWVYVFIVAMLVAGAVSAVRKVRTGVRSDAVEEN